MADARGIARLDAPRWASAAAVETLPGWGQDRCMVRFCDASDRLLGIGAIASTLRLLARPDRQLAGPRDHARSVLKHQAVLERRLTVGKLAEAIGLDSDKHRRAWAHAWLL